MRRNEMLNKKVIKALAVGASAVMLLQPVGAIAEDFNGGGAVTTDADSSNVDSTINATNEETVKLKDSTEAKTEINEQVDNAQTELDKSKVDTTDDDVLKLDTFAGIGDAIDAYNANVSGAKDKVAVEEDLKNDLGEAIDDKNNKEKEIVANGVKLDNSIDNIISKTETTITKINNGEETGDADSVIASANKEIEGLKDDVNKYNGSVGEYDKSVDEVDSKVDEYNKHVDVANEELGALEKENSNVIQMIDHAIGAVDGLNDLKVLAETNPDELTKVDNGNFYIDDYGIGQTAFNSSFNPDYQISNTANFAYEVFKQMVMPTVVKNNEKLKAAVEKQTLLFNAIDYKPTGLIAIIYQDSASTESDRTGYYHVEITKDENNKITDTTFTFFGNRIPAAPSEKEITAKRDENAPIRVDDALASADKLQTLKDKVVAAEEGIKKAEEALKKVSVTNKEYSTKDVEKVQNNTKKTVENTIDEKLKKPDPEVNPGKDPEVDPGKDPEVNPGKDPEVDPGKDPEVNPGTDPEVNPGKDPEVNPGTDPEVNPGKDPEVNPGTEPEVNPGTEPEVNPGKDPEVNPGTEPEVNPGTEPEVNPGTEPEANPGTDTETTPAAPVEETAPVQQETTTPTPAPLAAPVVPAQQAVVQIAQNPTPLAAVPAVQTPVAQPEAEVEVEETAEETTVEEVAEATTEAVAADEPTEVVIAEEATPLSDGTEVVIEDDATPLATLKEQQKMSWWWLLIVLILGTTGAELYRRHQLKKKEAENKEN